MKFENERCLECSICAIFFSSSLVDSISARLRRRILSDKTTMFTYIIDIEMFQTSEPTHVKHYEYGHDLGIGKTTRFVSMPLCVINGMFFNSFIKKMQKSSTIQKVSITLLLDNITFCSFVCTLKIQKISLYYSFLMNYFISNSR